MAFFEGGAVNVKIKTRTGISKLLVGVCFPGIKTPIFKNILSLMDWSHYFNLEVCKWIAPTTIVFILIFFVFLLLLLFALLQITHILQQRPKSDCSYLWAH